MFEINIMIMQHVKTKDFILRGVVDMVVGSRQAREMIIRVYYFTIY